MAGPSTELIIETPDGARYGVKSLAVKERLYPDAKVISFSDGTPYEAVEPAKPARARKPRKPRAKAAKPAPPANQPAPEEQGDGAD
jgi:hypothetical protein